MKKLLFLTVVLLLFAPSIVKAGEVRVYDNDDQFLGIYISGNSEGSLEIFIPSLNISCLINLSNGDIGGSGLFFTGIDCSGSRHSYYPGLFQNDYSNVFPDPPRYFLGLLQKTEVTYQSYHSFSFLPFEPPTCSNSSSALYLCVVVTFDIETLPFTIPVALPLRYEYVSDTPSVPAFSNLGLAILVSMLFIAGLFIMRKRA